MMRKATISTTSDGSDTRVATATASQEEFFDRHEDEDVAVEADEEDDDGEEAIQVPEETETTF